MNARKVIRITSAILLVIGIFLFLAMFFAGRGIIFMLPTGWVMLALFILTIVHFLQGGKFRRGAENSKTILGLSIAILVLCVLVLSWLTAIGAGCAVLNIIALSQQKGRDETTDANV